MENELAAPVTSVYKDRMNGVNGKTSRLSFRTPSRSSTKISTIESTTASNPAPAVKNATEWINQKSLRRIQRHHSVESYDTRQMYMTVLSNEENFVKGIDQVLLDHHQLQDRRKEILHSQWINDVYEPTRRKVETAFKDGFPALDARKREEYVKFLDYSNRKGRVCLDHTCPDEYDPLVLQHPPSPTLIKARTSHLQDPLLHPEKNRLVESRTQIYCDTGKLFSNDSIKRQLCPKLPLGRESHNSKTWLSIPLVCIDSPIRTRSKLRMKGTRNNTSFDFGSWIGHPAVSGLQDLSSNKNAVLTNT